MLFHAGGSCWGALHLRRELAEGQIAQQEGRVSFTNHDYRTQTVGRPLLNIDGGKEVSLPPGTYRFAYLPRSRRILSGEQQWTADPGGPYAGLLLALAQSNDFSLEDLAMNRQSQLSNQQRARLSARKKAAADHQEDLREGCTEMLEGFVQRKKVSSEDGSDRSYLLPGATFSITGRRSDN